MEEPAPNTQDNTLIFCCSGAADVGEIAHQAAHALDQAGHGMRFCLAGVAGRVPAHLAKCHSAQTILAIDGCRVGCSQRALAEAGVAQVHHLRVSEVGLAKGSSPVNPAHVRLVVEAATALLHRTGATDSASEAKPIPQSEGPR